MFTMKQGLLRGAAVQNPDRVKSKDQAKLPHETGTDLGSQWIHPSPKIPTVTHACA